MTTNCNSADGSTSQETTQYQAEADESPSMAVLQAVSATTGRSVIGSDVTEEGLDPLAESIAPEALNRVFESHGDAPEETLAVEFRYCDHQVRVRGGRTVCVTVE